jgi:hypothetical protein
MRARDLIGLSVVDSAGQRLGIVTDLRCVQDGPLLGAMHAPRVYALIVSSRHAASLLGYDRREQQGPWLLRRIVRAMHRNMQLVPWSAVADYEGRITLNQDLDALTNM